ncbi:hypothetical protein [Tindallia californiensis]|uniref:Glucosyl transferase GtrII n=1 Tax=Tindallia californiensis TaxID=159292 RepID=A0A1H3PCI4_9FIRM|nr:hypothetical protein [Tindallia californiensis]SDY98771.1 hypothetical protein SAMN05192546_106136 [Tindallia californiensis]
MGRRYYVAFFSLNTIIMIYFWHILGPNYTPLNDGWVMLTNLENGGFSLDWFVKNIFSYGGDPRIFRRTPYVIAGLLNGNNILVLKSILFSVVLMQVWGVYLVIDKFFPDNKLFSSVASLLTMYYPYDGTMFWLGAFGVNIGFCLGVFSIFFFIRSTAKESKLQFIISIILLYISCRTYSGYLPGFAAVVFIYIIIQRSEWKKWWMKAVIYFTTLLAHIWMYISRALSGTGREGAVADTNLESLGEGFLNALYIVYVDWILELLRISNFKTEYFLIILCIIGMYFYFIYVNEEKDLLIKNENTYCYFDGSKAKNITFVLFLISLVFLVSGYAPFAISDIRMGNERQLLFARSGAVILYSWIFIYYIRKLLSKQKKDTTCIAILAISLIVSLAIQNKAAIANEYSTASEIQRIFLGDMADAAPEISKDTHLVIYLKDHSFIVNKQLSMLLNRPQFPIRHLYEDSQINATTISPFYLNRFDAKIKGDETLYVRNKSININELAILYYDFEYGFKPLEKFSYQGGEKASSFTIDLPNENRLSYEDKYLTKRQKWFISERDRLVDKYGVSR